VVAIPLIHRLQPGRRTPGIPTHHPTWTAKRALYARCWRATDTHCWDATLLLPGGTAHARTGCISDATVYDYTHAHATSLNTTALPTTTSPFFCTHRRTYMGLILFRTPYPPPALPLCMATALGGRPRHCPTQPGLGASPPAAWTLKRHSYLRPLYYRRSIFLPTHHHGRALPGLRGTRAGGRAFSDAHDAAAHSMGRPFCIKSMEYSEQNLTWACWTPAWHH